MTRLFVSEPSPNVKRPYSLGRIVGSFWFSPQGGKLLQYPLELPASKILQSSTITRLMQLCDCLLNSNHLTILEISLQKTLLLIRQLVEGRIILVAELGHSPYYDIHELLARLTQVIRSHVNASKMALETQWARLVNQATTKEASLQPEADQKEEGQP